MQTEQLVELRLLVGEKWLPRDNLSDTQQSLWYVCQKMQQIFLEQFVLFVQVQTSAFTELTLWRPYCTKSRSSNFQKFPWTFGDHLLMQVNMQVNRKEPLDRLYVWVWTSLLHTQCETLKVSSDLQQPALLTELHVTISWSLKQINHSRTSGNFLSLLDNDKLSQCFTDTCQFHTVVQWHSCYLAHIESYIILDPSCASLYWYRSCRESANTLPYLFDTTVVQHCVTATVKISKFPENAYTF